MRSSEISSIMKGVHSGAWHLGKRRRFRKCKGGGSRI